MRVEGGVEQTLVGLLAEGSSKGWTKVRGGKGVAVMAWSRGRHLVDSYLVGQND